MTGQGKGIARSYSVENGYPGKTRSLVGDAKFEKLVRRESRQAFFTQEQPSGKNCDK